MFPFIHSEWWWALNEALLDAEAAALSTQTVIKKAIKMKRRGDKTVINIRMHVKAILMLL